MFPMFPTETNPSYYRARYFDPSPGRFLNEDPLRGGGGGLNFYSYVRNNSTNLVDPFGMNPDAADDPMAVDRAPSPSGRLQDAYERRLAARRRFLAATTGPIWGLFAP
jgi:RHS repeat-associated protein